MNGLTVPSSLARLPAVAAQGVCMAQCVNVWVSCEIAHLRQRPQNGVILVVRGEERHPQRGSKLAGNIREVIVFGTIVAQFECKRCSRVRPLACYPTGHWRGRTLLATSTEMAIHR